MNSSTLEAKESKLDRMPIIFAYCENEDQLYRLVSVLTKYLKTCTIDDNRKGASFTFKGLHEYKVGEALIIENSQDYEIVS